MAIVVNLFGGPGSGKSTMATSIFSELKWKGVDSELVTEFAKDMVWEESFRTLSNQLYVLGKQSHRNFRLNDKVDVMVTDSSVLMSLIYSSEDRHKLPEFEKVVINEFNHYDNINFFLDRNDYYVENGRYHSLEESKEIDERILNLMDENGIEYERVPFEKDSINIILNKVLEKLKVNVVEN